jgi:hypothetical protein
MSVQIGSLGNASGTVQMQLKPDFLLSENLKAAISGQSAGVSAILTSTALYLSIPGLSQSAVPWTVIPFSDLSGSAGSALSRAIQEAESGNPLSQTQILATSKNVRVVGTQVINGVKTTEYSGTVSPAAALSALSPSLSQQLAPELKLISGDISWTAWLDSQHMLRKVTENETVDGQQASVTVTITSVNQPVTITVPPASQVSTLPASALSGAGV